MQNTNLFFSSIASMQVLVDTFEGTINFL